MRLCAEGRGDPRRGKENTRVSRTLHKGEEGEGEVGGISVNDFFVYRSERLPTVINMITVRIVNSPFLSLTMTI